MKIILSLVHLLCISSAIMLLARYVLSSQHEIPIKALALLCILWVVAAGWAGGIWLNKTF